MSVLWGHLMNLTANKSIPSSESTEMPLFDLYTEPLSASTVACRPEEQEHFVCLTERWNNRLGSFSERWRLTVCLSVPPVNDCHLLREASQSKACPNLSASLLRSISRKLLTCFSTWVGVKLPAGFAPCPTGCKAVARPGSSHLAIKDYVTTSLFDLPSNRQIVT